MGSIKKEHVRSRFVPKKSLGQHFLVDRNVLNKVVQTAAVEREDVVLEVGPGLGQMTAALASRARKVIAVEIDLQLVEILKEKMKSLPNVEVISGDILKLDFKQFLGQEGRKIKVVSNLPYQISTPLLFRFMDSKETFSTLTLMVQREVAERMTAPPGGKEYGPLSIFVQMVADLSIPFLIKPSAFSPPPKVDSAVVHIVWRESPRVTLRDIDWFRRVVKGCFRYRRKMLFNGLRHSGLSLLGDVGAKLERIGIDLRRRPETLSIEEFARLSEAIKVYNVQ